MESFFNFYFPSVVYRKHDYDHYLCTLLLPLPVQLPAFIIRAFNVEVAQIHDLVTEKSTGQFRIQFWRDLLDSAYKVCVCVLLQVVLLY